MTNFDFLFISPDLHREVTGSHKNLSKSAASGRIFQEHDECEALAEEASYNFSLVLLQCLLLALYLMVLPVLILIHWGMGRFCLSFLANLVLIRNVLCALMVTDLFEAKPEKAPC